MKVYVNVSTFTDSGLPNIIFFGHKKFAISENISHRFINGVSIFRVRVGKKETVLYHEEIPRNERWYVMEKVA